jgi:hypothetical protein
LPAPSDRGQRACSGTLQLFQSTHTVQTAAGAVCAVGGVHTSLSPLQELWAVAGARLSQPAPKSSAPAQRRAVVFR